MIQEKTPQNNIFLPNTIPFDSCLFSKWTINWASKLTGVQFNQGEYCSPSTQIIELFAKYLIFNK